MKKNFKKYNIKIFSGHILLEKCLNKTKSVLEFTAIYNKTRKEILHKTKLDIPIIYPQLVYGWQRMKSIPAKHQLMMKYILDNIL